jgi:hypothetical protein
MDISQRQRLTGIRFRNEHLALLRQIWEHRIWDAPSMVAELEQISRKSRDTAYEARQKTPRHDERERSTETEHSHEDKAPSETESEDGEPQDIRSTYGDSDDDWEAEVSDSSLTGTRGMHHCHISSPTSTASPVVVEFLERCFQLNTALITDRFSHGRPQTSLLVYFSGVLGFSGRTEGFQPARNFTPILSRLIYMQRLLFLEYALPAHAYSHLGIARRSKERALDRLDPVALNI